MVHTSIDSGQIATQKCSEAQEDNWIDWEEMDYQKAAAMEELSRAEAEIEQLQEEKSVLEAKLARLAAALRSLGYDPVDCLTGLVLGYDGKLVRAELDRRLSPQRHMHDVAPGASNQQPELSLAGVPHALQPPPRMGGLPMGYRSQSLDSGTRTVSGLVNGYMARQISQNSATEDVKRYN
jgi:uncharacterized protein (UPF0335 family)